MKVKVKYASNECCGSRTFLPDDELTTVIVVPKRCHAVIMVKDSDAAAQLINQPGWEAFLGEPYESKETVWVPIENKDASPDYLVARLKELFKSANIEIVEEGIKPW